MQARIPGFLLHPGSPSFPCEGGRVRAFTKEDVLKVKLKNVGSQPVDEDFTVTASLNNGQKLTATVKIGRAHV